MGHRRHNRMMMRAASALLGAGVMVGVVGCEEQRPERTALEIRKQYAQHIVDGLEYGHSGVISGEKIDPETYDVINVRVDDGDRRLLHADRATIVVDVMADTFRVELRGIVKADADVGFITTDFGMATDDIPLEVDAIP